MIRNHELFLLVCDLRDMGATSEARRMEELILVHGEDSPQVAAEAASAREAMGLEG